MALVFKTLENNDEFCFKLARITRKSLNSMYENAENDQIKFVLQALRGDNDLFNLLMTSEGKAWLLDINNRKSAIQFLKSKRNMVVSRLDFFIIGPPDCMEFKIQISNKLSNNGLQVYVDKIADIIRPDDVNKLKEKINDSSNILLILFDPESDNEYVIKYFLRTIEQYQNLKVNSSDTDLEKPRSNKLFFYEVQLLDYAISLNKPIILLFDETYEPEIAKFDKVYFKNLSKIRCKSGGFSDDKIKLIMEMLGPVQFDQQIRDNLTDKSDSI